MGYGPTGIRQIQPDHVQTFVGFLGLQDCVPTGKSMFNSSWDPWYPGFLYTLIHIAVAL